MASLLAERKNYMLHAVAEESRTSQVKECKVPPLASRSPAEANPLDATQRQFVSPQASIDTPLLGRACPAASAPRGPSGMTPQQERIDSALREGPYGEVNCMPSNSTVKRSPLNRVVNCGTEESHRVPPNELARGIVAAGSSPSGSVQLYATREPSFAASATIGYRLYGGSMLLDQSHKGAAIPHSKPYGNKVSGPPPCHPEGRHGLGPRI